MPQGTLNAVTFDVISSTAHIPDDPNAPIEYKNDTISHPEVTSGKTGTTKV
jgi:tyrosinase